MQFRIRNNESEDESKHKECEKAYRHHLHQYTKSSNSDLWKYFYWDFFHDGGLESISLKEDLRTMVMRLNCPNIKRLKPDGDYEYLNASFNCTFTDLSSVVLHYDRPGVDWDSLNNSSLYLCSEINTSPLLSTLDRGEEDDPEQYYSLLIQFLVGDDCIWLEIVFHQVDIETNEPLAFSLMESDPKFEVPIYLNETDEQRAAIDDAAHRE